MTNPSHRSPFAPQKVFLDYVDTSSPSLRSEPCCQIARAQNTTLRRILTTSSIMLSHRSHSTFLQASRAGDAALDGCGRATLAESERSPALMSVTVPARSRASSLATAVKGLAWRHRLLRAPGMSKRSSNPTEPQAHRDA